jgi:hypothetical protein
MIMISPERNKFITSPIPEMKGIKMEISSGQATRTE